MTTTVSPPLEQATTDASDGLVAELSRLETVLCRRRDEPGERVAPPAPPPRRLSTLERLCDVFGLDSLEADFVMLALAPELDTRYQQLLAEIQGSPLRRRPSVALALELFTDDARARLAARNRFDPEAVLVRWGILTTDPDPVPGCDGLGSRALRLDRGLVDYLIGNDAVDGVQGVVARYLTIAAVDAELPGSLRKRILQFVERPDEIPERLRFRFVGAEGTGRTRAAGRLAAALGRPALRIDVARIVESGAAAADLWRTSLREACLHGAVLCLAGISASNEREWLHLARGLWSELEAWALPVILIGDSKSCEGLTSFPEAVRFEFVDASPDRRTALWRHYAEMAGVSADDEDLRRIGRRFRLTRREVEGAVKHVELGLRLTSGSGAPASVTQRMAAAARAVRGADLERLADRVRPVHRPRDLVLPESQRFQLDELISRIENAATVEDEWGFARHLPRARGVSVLFTGASGTGKTMAAESIACELGLDLFKTRMSAIVSKYIGETEKNLERLFEAAEGSNGVLFFDECDAIFGKRSEVRDSHDRYANQEISYLLQRIESYDGIAILATNLHDHLDEAFRRRLTASIHFPFPSAELRLELWHRIWPADAPVDESVDFDWLARTLELTGGSIRNVALTAAFFAVADGGVIELPHLLRAAQREYGKLGRGTLAIDELVSRVASVD
jgi:AAA+ superfamily predicted ATPase